MLCLSFANFDQFDSLLHFNIGTGLVLNFSDNERMETSLKGFSHQSRSILLIWPGKFFWNIIQKEKMFFSNGEWEWSKKPPSVNSIIGEIFPPIPFRQTLQNCSPIWSKFTYIPFNPGKSYTYFNQSRQGFHVF